MSDMNERAAALSSKDSVLFLFNLESGYNYSSVDVNVTRPVRLDNNGRTEVNIEGLNYKGLSGVGAVDGIARFTYIRRNLGHLGIAVDGSFFSVFSGKPSFLGAVEEFRRKTGFNCDAKDFDPFAFEPDANGNRRLKAAVDSWRFVGEVNLGRPVRDIIGEVVPQDVRASLESYRGIFWANADRFKADMIITHMAADYARVSVGFVLDRATDPLVPFIVNHLREKGVDASFSVGNVDWVNIYRAQVTYKGPLRPGDVAPLERLNRVLVFKLAAPPGLWSSGELKMWFTTEALATPSMSSSTLTAINLVTPELVNVERAAMLNAVQVGALYRTIGSPRAIADLWLAATGLQYSASNFDTLRCTYNGPHRPSDQLPLGVASCRVIEFSRTIPPTTGFSGPIKFHYKVD